MPAISIRFLVHQAHHSKLTIVKKILVIEDDADIADIVEMALTERYIVRTQTDNTCIEKDFQHFKPDLIMIDNQVGQMEAPDIVAELKKNNELKNIPFVLFSGHHEIQRIAGEIDAKAYLSKPFSLVDLYSCIDEVFSKCA